MDINIRNFPVELARELKVLSAGDGNSLRSTIIGIIETHLMERHNTPELAAYIDKAYPDEKVDLMQKMRTAKATLAPFTITAPQREILRAEEDELIYERDEYSQI